MRQLKSNIHYYKHALDYIIKAQQLIINSYADKSLLVIDKLITILDYKVTKSDKKKVLEDQKNSLQKEIAFYNDKVADLKSKIDELKNYKNELHVYFLNSEPLYQEDFKQLLKKIFKTIQDFDNESPDFTPLANKASAFKENIHFKLIRKEYPSFIRSSLNQVVTKRDEDEVPEDNAFSMETSFDASRKDSFNLSFFTSNFSDESEHNNLKSKLEFDLFIKNKPDLTRVKTSSQFDPFNKNNPGRVVANPSHDIALYIDESDKMKFHDETTNQNGFILNDQQYLMHTYNTLARKINLHRLFDKALPSIKGPLALCMSLAIQRYFSPDFDNDIQIKNTLITIYEIISKIEDENIRESVIECFSKFCDIARPPEDDLDEESSDDESIAYSEDSSDDESMENNEDFVEIAETFNDKTNFLAKPPAKRMRLDSEDESTSEKNESLTPPSTPPEWRCIFKGT